MFQEYFERDLSIIPIFKHGKNPAISEWSKFCQRLPTQDEIDLWEKGDYNYGIACGPASNIIVLDIDTDDKEILNKCPRSPVVRRGSKGEARFFKYNPNIRSQSIPQIDILADGRQSLIPPSIHPVTKRPYVWLTPDTLENFDVKDLPDLDMAFIKEISTKVSIQPTGRNNKLVDIVSAMRGRGEPETDIIHQVYEWDKSFHVPRLFLDATEGFKGSNETDAKRNAWKLVNSVTRTLIDKGTAVLSEHQLVLILDESKPTTIHRALEFPMPKGVMGDIMRLINGASERDMPNLALGGTVALMASLCCNKYRFDNTWPNLYVLNLAPTGCVDGETMIQINRAKNSTSITIKKAWENQVKENMGGRKRKADVVTMVRGLKNGQIGLIPSDGIVHSGFKECIKLTSESGKSLVLTPEHLIFSNGMWIEARYMLNRLWGIDNIRPVKTIGPRKKKHDSYLGYLKYHPYASIVESKRDGLHRKIEMHRAIYEAHLNRLTLAEFKSILRTDEKKSKELSFIDTKKMVIHHKDYDHYNNDIANLACVSKEEHRIIHNNYSNFSQGLIGWEPVIKIESVGVREVFDVVNTPSQSFTANNIVIHNSGKSFPQRVVKKILEEELGTGIMGFGNYRSSSALVKNLVSKRERLDIIDEVSSLFAQMKSGGLYQMEILEELCKLWSDSNTKYLAGEYAEREDTSTCYNPCINLLGSSTIEGIKANMGRFMTVKGLIPRFLIFSHDSYGKFKDDHLDEKLLRKVSDRLRPLWDMDKPERRGVKVDLRHGPMYDPIDLTPIEKSAVKFFQEIRIDFAQRVESDISETSKHMITRGKEQIMKLAILHAVSKGAKPIDLEDLSWAKDVFDVSLHNAKLFLEEASVDGDYEKDVISIQNTIAKKDFTTMAFISNLYKRMPPQRIKTIIDTLINSEVIQLAEKKNKQNGFISKGYTTLNKSS